MARLPARGLKCVCVCGSTSSIWVESLSHYQESESVAVVTGGHLSCCWRAGGRTDKVNVGTLLVQIMACKMQYTIICCNDDCDDGVRNDGEDEEEEA